MREKNAKSKDEYFIAAINLMWIKKASLLPGHALHVAVAIWFHKGLKKKNWGQSFPLGIASAAYDFGVSRSAVGRALRELEVSRLISVKRQKGAKTIVTVLKPEKLNADSYHGIPSADESFFENLEKENKEYSSHICKDVV